MHVSIVFVRRIVIYLPVKFIINMTISHINDVAYMTSRMLAN